MWFLKRVLSSFTVWQVSACSQQHIPHIPASDFLINMSVLLLISSQLPPSLRGLHCMNEMALPCAVGLGGINLAILYAYINAQFQ